MRRILSMILCAVMIASALAFIDAETVTDVRAEIVEGEGNCFEVTNSTYLNVTLCSSEVVNVTLESVPNVVSFTIRRVTSAQTTEVTISGLEVNKLYFRHEDGYMVENFTTDEGGTHSYIQDISVPHHVFIQEEVSTIRIPSGCSYIGTWDSLRKMCVLTKDVYTTLLFTMNWIGIDGNGHSIIKGSGSYGIYAYARKGLTITNLTVSGFSSGIWLHSSTGNTIIGNTISGGSDGIRLESSTGNTISGNAVSGSFHGVDLHFSNGNTVVGNTMSGNVYGLWVWYSEGTTISGNTITNSNGPGIVLWSSHDSTISGNTVSNNREFGITLRYSQRATISGNIVSGNWYGHFGYGIRLYWSSTDSTVSGNSVSGSKFGIVLECDHNMVVGNKISGNWKGLYLYTSNYNTIFHNSIYDTLFIQGWVMYNTWDNGAGEGNYWDDYAGSDDGSGGRVPGDGVGDTNLPHKGLDWYPLMEPYVNTPVGPDVEVEAGSSVSMHFSDITSPGVTTAETVPGSPPANFKLVPTNTFYSITTTAGFEGIINISINYDDSGLSEGKERNLKLKYLDETTGDWVDITTWVDTVNNMIYGETAHLSIFAVMLPENDPPAATITGPASGSIFEILTPVQFTATFTDPDTGDTHTAQWTFTSSGSVITIPGTVTESGGSGSVNDEVVFTIQGIYSVSLTITDDGGLTDTATMVDDLPAMVVIYDPEGGFMTGGGWIWSPPGAYADEPSLEGKASFGFVSKYKRGADTPTGNTEFQFKAGDLNFHSDSYEWLVIAGPRAQFKGTGTINGEGEYKFMLTAVDGDLPGGGGVDKFRIKIWLEDMFGNENVIYDNMLGAEDNSELDPTTEIGGGQIVIHKQ